MKREAIILAAGEGRRLLPLTEKQPKTMLKVTRYSILENALKAFKQLNLDRVIIVIGHLGKMIESYFGASYNGLTLEYVYNNDYTTTNSMYSLHLGLQSVKGEVWVLEGDVFFDSSVLSIDCSSSISWFADSSMNSVDGAYLIADNNNRIISIDIIRDLALIKSEHFKSIGLLKLDPQSVYSLREWLNGAVKKGNANLYYDLIIKDHINDYDIKVVDVKGNKWYEIDTLDDLEVARKIFQ